MSHRLSSPSRRTGYRRSPSVVAFDFTDVSAHHPVPSLFRSPSPSLPASVTISDICGDPVKFALLSHGSCVDVTESNEHLDFVVDNVGVLEASVVPRADNSEEPPGPASPQDQEKACLKQLCEMVIFQDQEKALLNQLYDMVKNGDPYKISASAPQLISLWLRFNDVKSSPIEARFRGPLDQLIWLPFSGVLDKVPRLHTIVEVPLKVSFLPDSARSELDTVNVTMANDPKAYIDCAVLRVLEFVSQSLHADKMLHDGFARHLLAEVVIEFKVDNLEQVANQVVLGMTAGLYHRKRLGLLDKPVYGIAVCQSSVIWFYGCWTRRGSNTSPQEENRISINRTEKHSLKTFAHWVCFYVSLVRLRELLRDDGPVEDKNILKMPVEEVINDWSSTGSPSTPSRPSNTKRRRSEDDTTGSHKQRRTKQDSSVSHDDAVLCPTPLRPSSPPEWLISQ